MSDNQSLYSQQPPGGNTYGGGNQGSYNQSNYYGQQGSQSTPQTGYQQQGGYQQQQQSYGNYGNTQQQYGNSYNQSSGGAQNSYSQQGGYSQGGYNRNSGGGYNQNSSSGGGYNKSDSGNSGGGGYGSRGGDSGGYGGRGDSKDFKFGGRQDSARPPMLGNNKLTSDGMIIQEDTVFVRGLPTTADVSEINDYFGQIGIIKTDKRTKDPKIWIYKSTDGTSKGECTVTYDDVEASQAAVDWFNGKTFGANTISVVIATRKAPEGGFGKVRGRGRGGGRGRGFGDRGGRGGGRGGFGRGGDSRDGDWDCPKCNNKNFARRSECNRCGESRSGGGGGGGGRYSSGGYGGDGRRGGGDRDRDRSRR